MTEINNNYRQPYDYQTKVTQNNGGDTSGAATTSAKDNFIEVINERLGTGDKTAIAELEAKGIPATVIEMENGYKVQYTYGRQQYTVTYFEPSDTNKNTEDVPDSGNTNKTTESPNTTPDTGDDTVKRSPNIHNTTPNDNIKIEESNILYSNSGIPSEELKERSKNTETYILEHYNWMGWDVDDLATFKACEEIRPGVWGTKDKDGNYQIQFYDFPNGYGNNLKKAPIPQKGEILDEIIKCYNNSDTTKAEQCVQLYLAITGEDKLEIIQNEEGKYISASDVDKYNDARPIYTYGGEIQNDKYKETCEYLTEFFANNPKTNKEFVLSDRMLMTPEDRIFLEEIAQGIWGTKDENGNIDIYAFFDGEELHEYYTTEWFYKNDQYRILPNPDGSVGGKIEDLEKELIHKKGDKWEPVSSPFHKDELDMVINYPPSAQEVLEEMMNSTGIKREAYAQLYMALTGKDSVEVFLNPKGDLVTTSDETKEKPEANNIRGMVTSAEQILESEEGLNWLIEKFGLNDPWTYDFEASKNIHNGQHIGAEPETGLVQGADGQTYFTVESAWRYYWNGMNHSNDEQIVHSPYPDKDSFANFLRRVCDTEDKCDTESKFRARLNEYFKSIGGTTNDGENYMVTFEQLMKAYINCENMPEGFDTNDKTKLQNNFINAYNNWCITRGDNNIYENKDAYLKAYGTKDTPHNLFSVFQREFKTRPYITIEEFMQSGGENTKYVGDSCSHEQYSGISKETFDKYILGNIQKNELPEGFMLLDVFCKYYNITSYEEFIATYQNIPQEDYTFAGVKYNDGNMWQNPKLEALIDKAFEYFGLDRNATTDINIKYHNSDGTFTVPIFGSSLGNSNPITSYYDNGGNDDTFRAHILYEYLSAIGLLDDYKTY